MDFLKCKDESKFIKKIISMIVYNLNNEKSKQLLKS